MGRLFPGAPRLEDVYAVSSSKELGRGEYGIVRPCVERSTGRVFACKTVDRQRLQKADRLDDLRMELHCMGVLPRHPNLVHLVSVHEDEEEIEGEDGCQQGIHMVMEHCESGDLFSLVADSGRLPEAFAAQLFRQVVTAVAFCHSHGVAHLDIKPENILLQGPLPGPISPFPSSSSLGSACSRDDPFCSPNSACAVTAKLADFGQALPLSPGQQCVGVAGSAFYMAPEVVCGLKYDFSADLWSLGVLLYVMLSGQMPFWGSTTEETFVAICCKQPELQAQPWPFISPQAKHLISALLSLDASQRPTAEQVLQHPWLSFSASTAERTNPSLLRQQSLPANQTFGIPSSEQQHQLRQQQRHQKRLARQAIQQQRLQREMEVQQQSQLQLDLTYLADPHQQRAEVLQEQRRHQQRARQQQLERQQQNVGGGVGRSRDPPRLARLRLPHDPELDRMVDSPRQAFSPFSTSSSGSPSSWNLHEYQQLQQLQRRQQQQEEEMTDSPLSEGGSWVPSPGSDASGLGVVSSSMCAPPPLVDSPGDSPLRRGPTLPETPSTASGSPHRVHKLQVRQQQRCSLLLQQWLQEQEQQHHYGYPRQQQQALLHGQPPAPTVVCDDAMQVEEEEEDVNEDPLAAWAVPVQQMFPNSVRLYPTFSSSQDQKESQQGGGATGSTHCFYPPSESKSTVVQQQEVSEQASEVGFSGGKWEGGPPANLRLLEIDNTGAMNVDRQRRSPRGAARLAARAAWMQKYGRTGRDAAAAPSLPVVRVNSADNPPSPTGGGMESPGSSPRSPMLKRSRLGQSGLHLKPT